jgi:hypothetical protein
MANRPERLSDEALREVIAKLRNELREVADFEEAEWPGLLATLESELTARIAPMQDLPFRIDFSNVPKGVYMVMVGDTAKLCTHVADPTCVKARDEKEEMTNDERLAFGRGLEVGEKVAALRMKLRQAKHHREQLNYPLFVRVSDEPRVERHATVEELEKWQASADGRIEALEREIAELCEPAAVVHVAVKEGT